MPRATEHQWMTVRGLSKEVGYTETRSESNANVMSGAKALCGKKRRTEK